MSCGDKKYFGNMIPITGSPVAQKGVALVAGPGIDIQDQSDTSNYKFLVSAIEIEDLSVSLSLVAKAATVPQTSPILKGTVIDELNLTWTYNKTIVSQTLTNTGALTPPTLDAVTFSYDYTAQNIQSNLSLTIQGNDGLGQPGSIASDTKSISFGNLLWLGAGSSLLNQPSSSVEAFIESLTGVIKTSRAHTYFATGGANQKHFVAYPKAWGLATFTKGVFTGGYWRLKNVSGILKVVLGEGETESDLIITNSAGHAEAYYLYETEYDNQADNITSFTIS